MKTPYFISVKPIQATKLAGVGYSLLYTIIIFFTLKHPILLNTQFVYFLLIAFFIVGIATGLNSSEFLKLLIIFSAASLPFLIVLDPVELGLYGHDPYTFTFPAAWEYLQDPNIPSLMNEQQAWPTLYMLYDALLSITDINPILVGKYLPIITLSIPLFLYTAAVRITNSNVGFLLGMSAAGNRGLFLFEVKFVEEIIAVVYVYLILYLLLKYNKSKKQFLVFNIISIPLWISHLSSALFINFLIGCVYFVPQITQHLPGRLRTSPNDSNYLVPFVVSLIGLLTVIFFYSPTFTAQMIISLISTQPNPNSTLKTVSSISIFSGLFYNALLGGISLYILSKYVSNYEFSSWQISLSVYSSFMLIAYFCIKFIVGSEMVPLDSSRINLFLTPILLLVAYTILADRRGSKNFESMLFTAVLLLFLLQVSILSKSGFNNNLEEIALITVFLIIIALSTYLIESDNSLNYIIIIISILCITTQIFAIPPHVLFTDPSTTSVDEGHYTPSQFETSEWVAKYSEKTVFGYEPGLWVHHGNSFRYITDGSPTCPNYLAVSRIDASQEPQLYSNVIYDTRYDTIFCNK